MFSSKRKKQKINLSESLYDSMNMYLKKLVNKDEISSKEKLIELYTDMRNSFENILYEKKKSSHKTSFGHNKTPCQNVDLPGASDTATKIDPNDTAGDKYLRKVIGYFDMLIELTKDDKYELENWYETTSYYGQLLENQKLEFHILKSFLELKVPKNARATRPIDLIRKIGAKLKSEDFKVILKNVYNDYEKRKKPDESEAEEQSEANNQPTKTNTELDEIKELLQKFVEKNLKYKRLIEMKGISREEKKTREIQKLGAVIRLKLVELWASQNNTKCEKEFLAAQFHDSNSTIYSTTSLPWGISRGIIPVDPGDYDSVRHCLTGYPLGNAMIMLDGAGLKATKAWIDRGDEPNLTLEEKNFLKNVNNINKNYSTQILRNK